MATKHDVHALTTSGTAYEIVPALAGHGKDVTIQNNNASATVYLGGPGVTSSDFGFKLVAGAAISFELDGRDSIWAVGSANDATVNTLIINLEASRNV